MTATIAYRCPMSSTEPDHSSKFVAALASVGGFIGGAWGWLRARENRAKAQAEMLSEVMRRQGSLESRMESKEQQVDRLNEKIAVMEATIADLRRKDTEQQGEIDHLKCELEIAKQERDDALSELSALTKRMNAEEKR